jgi:hypothetical protein
MRRRSKWQQRERFERVLGLYSLGVVFVQCALIRGDWVVWAVCWGWRRGLSPVVWVRSSFASCANGHGPGFSRRAPKS